MLLSILLLLLLLLQHCCIIYDAVIARTRTHLYTLQRCLTVASIALQVCLYVPVCDIALLYFVASCEMFSHCYTDWILSRNDFWLSMQGFKGVFSHSSLTLSLLTRKMHKTSVATAMLLHPFIILYDAAILYVKHCSFLPITWLFH